MPPHATFHKLRPRYLGPHMTDTKTISYYDASVDAYIDMVSRDKPDADLQSFIDTVPKGGTVLDLGCGPGNSAAMMQAAGLIAYATDASAEMVRAATNALASTQHRHASMNWQTLQNTTASGPIFLCCTAPKFEMPANLTRIHTALKTKTGYATHRA